jgi:hypothetical protein
MGDSPLRAVGVRNNTLSWYGAIQAGMADGYVWVCLDDHPSLAAARACAERRLAIHAADNTPWTGPGAPAYHTVHSTS